MDQKHLSKESQDFVAEKLDAGEYGSEEEVIETGIRALRFLDKEYKALCREVAIGITAADDKNIYFLVSSTPTTTGSIGTLALA